MIEAVAEIFISYRRDAAKGRDFTARIYDRLQERFGKGKIFFDSESIVPGKLFDARIRAALEACRIFIPAIGKHWLQVKDGSELTEDYVQIEVSTALERHKDVIPLLLDGARIPSLSQLPESMARLRDYQWLEVRYIGFEYDVSRLIEHLEKDYRVSSPAKQVLLYFAAGLAVAVGLILIVSAGWSPHPAGLIAGGALAAVLGVAWWVVKRK